MKKLYIHPVVDFEQIEISDVTQTSWGTDSGDWTDNPEKKDEGDPNGSLIGGGEFGDAKQGSLDFSDDFAFQLDM